ncbi:MAG: hypothetical protein EXR62_15865 [Chloroflexi bacterium]|nr:hypothetical protein [Chloroflexota bacterium]
MDLTLIPLLQVQHELYEIPRGMERFNKYIAAMTGGTDDIALPLVSMNPMGKEHILPMLDTLIGMGAEEIAATAIAAAARRFRHVTHSERRFQVGLVVVDDAKGGWTNRYFTEMGAYFAPQSYLKRGFITVSLWTSELWPEPRIYQQTLTYIYHSIYVLCCGQPQSLRQMMVQAGLAEEFAGTASASLDPADLAYTREVIQPYLDATDQPTTFACLYGDAAAKSAGYPPIGLSAGAGYALALDDARRRAVTPEGALCTPPGSEKRGA